MENMQFITNNKICKERYSENKDVDSIQESEMLGKFLDFLMEETEKNPSSLVPYTEERDREIEELLEGVILDDEDY